MSIGYLRKAIAAICMTLLAAVACVPGALAQQAGRDAKEATEATEAANPARDVFLRLDVSVLEILNKDTREYMMSYWDVDSIVDVANEFNGLSRLDTVAPGYLKVELTDVSTLQIKILPLKNGGKLAMTVYTIGGSEEAPDSEVRFFSYPELSPLETSRYFKAPELKSYFSIPKGCATDMKEIRDMIPFPTYVFNASATDDNLMGKLTIGEYINRDDYNILKIFLKPEAIYTWNGKKYEAPR